MLLAASLGVVMGLVVGALGGGGGVLTVPLLVYVLGLSAQSATTSSIVIVGLTALVGTLARVGAHRIDRRTGLIFGALGIPSAYLGTVANHAVDQHVLLIGFAVTAVVAAVALLTCGSGEPGASAIPAVDRRFATAAKVVTSGLVIGFLTGFLGVGGGFLVVPVLVIVLRMPMPHAVGTSLLIITLNSASSLASRLGAPLHLDWRIVVPFTVLAVAGSLFGTRIADRFSGDALARSFAAMLVLVGGYVAATTLGLI